MDDVSLKEVATVSFPTREEFLALYEPFFKNKKFLVAAAGIIIN